MLYADSLLPQDSMTGTCPCCGDADTEALAFPTAHHHCSHCGHRWRAADPGTQNRYYAALRDRNAVPVKVREQKLTERIRYLTPLLQDNMRILEIGCAEGDLGARIKALARVHFTGIELSVDADMAASVLDRVIRAPAASLSDESYELLLSFHVLEHIPDVAAEVRQWRRLLIDAGTAVVEVPERSGHRLLPWDSNPEHLHQFTAASFIALFEHSGFEITSLTSGHFESPVYNNSLRLHACLRPANTVRQTELLARFRSRLPTPFCIYGIGGDFRNYVAPLLDVLPVIALLDSDHSRHGEQIGSLTVAPFDPVQHGKLPILIASIRFEAEIAARLVATGMAANLLFGLGDIYGDGT